MMQAPTLTRPAIAVAQGDDRRANIRAVLEQLDHEMAWSEVERLLIKPNFVATDRQLPSTHPDALHALLDFVRARYSGPITIAEGSALASTWQAFHHFGLPEMAQRYDVTLLDLNSDDTIAVQVYDRHLRPMTLRLARSVVESDCRISIGPPKTHDTVIVTLALKNMIMGSLVNRRVAGHPHAHEHRSPTGLVRLVQRVTHSWLLQRLLARLHIGERSDKIAMHQSYPVINLNLAMLAPWVMPHLAILDGFEAMEGAGPVHGDPVPWRVALASTDALALDCAAARLMGFEPLEVGYLHYCARLGLGHADAPLASHIDPASVQHPFRPHPTYPQQRQWQLPEAATLLERARRAE